MEIFFLHCFESKAYGLLKPNASDSSPNATLILDALSLACFFLFGSTQDLFILGFLKFDDDYLPNCFLFVVLAFW